MSGHVTNSPKKEKVEVGFQAGAWEVIRRAAPANGVRRWRCRCACGRIAVWEETTLRRGLHCWHSGHRPVRKRRRRAGALEKAHPREYVAWKQMLGRCRQPKRPDYHCYGGRGVRVCEQWQGEDGFARFLADVGAKPSLAHTLDRYPDPSGHYEPGNVRWATRKEQSRNLRNNRLLTHEGRTLCVAAWGEELGLSPNLIYVRLKRGWAATEALTVPAGERRGVRNGATPALPAVPEEAPRLGASQD